jgi:hypothetical protein
MTKTIPKGKYQHYKGNYYQVIDFAKNSETLEDMVVCRALYGEKELWVRPLKMFLETVEVNGQPMPRFNFVK